MRGRRHSVVLFGLCFCLCREHNAASGLFLHQSWLLKTGTLPLVRCCCCLQKLQKAAFKHKMLLIPSGARESIRFLPPLNISAQETDMALDKFEACCKEVFG